MSGLFHIVWNLNISPNVFNKLNVDLQKDIISTMHRTLNQLKANISSYTTRNAELDEFIFYLEVGKERRYLHADGVLRFKSYTRLKYNDIREFLNENMAIHSIGRIFIVSLLRIKYR